MFILDNVFSRGNKKSLQQWQVVGILGECPKEIGVLKRMKRRRSEIESPAIPHELEFDFLPSSFLNCFTAFLKENICESLVFFKIVRKYKIKVDE